MREKTDPALGVEIQRYLEEKGVNTPMTAAYQTADPKKIEVIETHMKAIMDALGLDLTDDSLIETPKRVAKMYVNELFWGLKPENFPKCTTVDNKMGYDEMVLERNIKVMSDCEHHLRTIVGVAHVAYMPKDKVLGLSKLNRVVEYFSRRPQIQERLAEQIYHALVYILGTEDVAVVIEAEHFCVKQRGVEDCGSDTVTSKMGGRFRENAPMRAEFMSFIKA